MIDLFIFLFFNFKNFEFAILHFSNLANKALKYLRPNDVYQFLYQLEPISCNLMNRSSINPAQFSSNNSNSIQIGRLDINWRSTMGDQGRLQTNILKYEVFNLFLIKK